ncbi:MAG: zinc ribbon domain-containing protein [Caldilineaceae bacterium]|nr:zinc ribbon domain-containing protein [Caldilineaceae bacterium]
MPIYEYVCLDCRKRVNVFFRTFSDSGTGEAHCPTCSGTKLHRLVSRVAVMKSEESRMENLADPSLLSGLESEDPRALANFMRRMSDETGEPLDAEMTEVLNRLDAGESPEAIEQSLPDMADTSGGSGGDDLGI